METLRVLKRGELVIDDEDMGDVESIYINYYGDKYAKRVYKNTEVIKVEIGFDDLKTNLIDYMRWLEDNLCVETSIEYLNNRLRYNFPLSLKMVSIYSVCIEGSPDMIKEFKKGLLLVGCKIN
jgi:predicted dehydrogenase